MFDALNFSSSLKQVYEIRTCVRVRLCDASVTARLSALLIEGGDVAQLVKRRTGTLLTQVRFPGAAREFSPGVDFQCRLSYGVRTPPCAIACINTCAHVKDPVVHVRVRWIVETQH